MCSAIKSEHVACGHEHSAKNGLVECFVEEDNEHAALPGDGLLEVLI